MDKLIYKLNQFALKRTYDYINLNIHGKKVRCPFYMNKLEADIVKYMKKSDIDFVQIEKFRKYYRNRKLEFAWYRGKGKPEEIIKSTIDLSEMMGLPLTEAKEDVILEFMKLHGLGVDCSGFVFETLRFAFEKSLLEKEFLNMLDWEDKNKKVAERAGAFVFSGKASKKINPGDIKPLDLILISGNRNNYSHVSLIVERNNKFYIAQSNFSTGISGVNLSRLIVTNNQPTFKFKPQVGKTWENLYKDKQLEFRKLTLLC